MVSIRKCSKVIRYLILCYTVLRWQVVVACPVLMDFLARTGNASHGAERVMTVLQACKRLHATAKATKDGAEIDWSSIVSRTSVLSPPELRPGLVHCAAFTKAWSGGKEGHILLRLERFERTLDIKRKIDPIDLGLLAKVNLPEAPEWVPAMVMAMLTAPINFTKSGYSALFNSHDFGSLGLGGRSRAHAITACELHSSAKTFMDA